MSLLLVSIEINRPRDDRTAMDTQDSFPGGCTQATIDVLHISVVWRALSKQTIMRLPTLDTVVELAL